MLNAPATPHALPHWDNGLLYYTFPILDQFSDRLLHAFSTRVGGVSRGGWSTLNLGLARGDDLADVRENHRRFSVALGCDTERAAFSRQVHDTQVRLVTAQDVGCGLRREPDYDGVDGLLTATPQLPLITNYADCTPLLFYAADKHIACTSHAGWRGTAANMAGASVAAMAAQGCDPAQLFVAVGPCAGPCCYQVDADVAERFFPICDELGPCARPQPGVAGKYLIDMPRANRAQLRAAGVPDSHIELSGLCTICHPEVFFSSRVHGSAERGALIALVMLK